MAICAVQAALSLTLVWSNTAYIDEANNLWVGRLEIAHWLHGDIMAVGDRLPDPFRIAGLVSACWAPLPPASAASRARGSFR